MIATKTISTSSEFRIAPKAIATKATQTVGRRSAREVNAGAATENAVYAYIQALRALGHTRTNTALIARALGLKKTDVVESIAALTKRGVKIAG